jgi:hypothetical protein
MLLIAISTKTVLKGALQTVLFRRFRNSVSDRLSKPSISWKCLRLYVISYVVADRVEGCDLLNGLPSVNRTRAMH